MQKVVAMMVSLAAGVQLLHVPVEAILVAPAVFYLSSDAKVLGLAELECQLVEPPMEEQLVLGLAEVVVVAAVVAAHHAGLQLLVELPFLFLSDV